MSFSLILLVVVILLAISSLPVYPYSQNWGYAPGGVFSIVIIVLLFLILSHRI